MSTLLHNAKLGRQGGNSGTTLADPFPSAMFVGDLDAGGGHTWTQIFHDDFSGYPVLPVGSFVPLNSGELSSTCAAWQWFHNTWSFYPDTWNTTHGGVSYAKSSTEPGYIAPGQPGYPAMWPPINSKYYPSKTLSVENVPGLGKVLQVAHHTENIGGVDTFVGANMKPKNPAGPYLLDAYYRIQWRMRSTACVINGVDRAAVNDFASSPDGFMHWVPLGIDSNHWPSNGELDWPEGSIVRPVAGNYHPADPVNNTQHVTSGESPYQLNQFTEEWRPGSMKWWTNRNIRLDTADRVPTGPLAWQLQHESDWRQPPLTATALVQIKDVAIWKWV